MDGSVGDVRNETRLRRAAAAAAVAVECASSTALLLFVPRGKAAAAAAAAGSRVDVESSFFLCTSSSSSLSPARLSSTFLSLAPILRLTIVLYSFPCRFEDATESSKDSEKGTTDAAAAAAAASDDEDEDKETGTKALNGPALREGKYCQLVLGV